MDLRELHEDLRAKTECFDKALDAGVPTSELMDLYKQIKVLKHQLMLMDNPAYSDTVERQFTRNPSEESMRADLSQG